MEEARELKHPHCGTEHIILAILRSGDNIANKALRELVLDYMTIKKLLTSLVGEHECPPDDVIPYSAHLQMVLKELQTIDFIRPQHLLLAITNQEDCLAMEFLRKLFVQKRNIRETIDRLQAESQLKEAGRVDSEKPLEHVWGEKAGTREEPGGTEKKKKKRRRKKSTIEDFFDEGLQRVICRAREQAEGEGRVQVSTTDLLLSILNHKESNAARLLHRAGVSTDSFIPVARMKHSASPQKASGVETAQFSIHSNVALKLGYESARSLGEKKMGIDHLMLGLLGESQSTAYNILNDMLDNAAGMRKILLREINTQMRIEFIEKTKPILLGKPTEIKAKAALGDNFKKEVSAQLKAVFDQAAVEAVTVGDAMISSLHLLIALADAKSISTATIFKEFGITGETMREALASAGDTRVVRSGAIPLSWEVKIPLDNDMNSVAASASIIAESAKSKEIVAEQILEALLQYENTAATKVLKKLGVDLETILKRIKD